MMHMTSFDPGDWAEGAPLTFRDAFDMIEEHGELGGLRWRDDRYGKLTFGKWGERRLSFYGTGRHFPVAKFVWFRNTGEWPPGNLRRRNGNVRDDRFPNLIARNFSDVSDLI